MRHFGPSHHPRSRVGVLALCFAAVSAVEGCSWPTDLPSGSQLFIPPTIYTRWWEETERCSGLTGSFQSIRWFRAPGSNFTSQGEDASGSYSFSGHFVVLAGPHVDDGGTVRHEMLHALIASAGHPRDQFLDKCKDVVVCTGQCVKDAGPWHAPAQFVPLPVDSMRISSTVAALPAETDGQHWVALTVMATNPLATPIFALPDGAWLTWGVENGVVSVSLSADDSSSLYFDGHQTRTWTFEMRVDDSTDRYTLSPGPHDIDGGFGQHWTPFTHILAAP